MLSCNSSLVALASKPRVFVLTDIDKDPDDEQSFCRYLAYSNQFRTEGAVAVTSTWIRTWTTPENLHKVIDGYEKVVDNLNAHVHPNDLYPSAAYMRSIVRSGPTVYGVDAVGRNTPLSGGGELLLQSVLKSDPEPLWVISWGGINVLAEVLDKIQREYSESEATQLRSRLRVYTISDQDDSGPWIRRQFPDLFYICSVHGWNQYMQAAWIGISSSVDEGGADSSKLTREWIKENIQIGPLGAVYPDHRYIVEGDTPTTLYLIQNGLGVPEEPSYGSWGGRYLPVTVGKNGYPRGHFADTEDEVVGKDGKKYRSNHATVWRWRDAFQSDFAARMQWTMTNDFSKANHAPIVSVNGDTGLAPVYVEAEAGSVLSFDASESYDPDAGDILSFNWYQYREPTILVTYHPWEVANVEIKKLNVIGSKAEIAVPPADKSCINVLEGTLLARGQLLHIILEVKDNGSPHPMTTYRRIMIQVLNSEIS